MRAWEAGRVGGGASVVSPAFPGADVSALIDTTWTGRALFNDGLGLPHRLTDMARDVALMPGVDPEDLPGRQMGGADAPDGMTAAP